MQRSDSFSLSKLPITNVELKPFDAVGITGFDQHYKRKDCLEAIEDSSFALIRRKDMQDGDFKSEAEFEEFILFSKQQYYFKNWPKYWIAKFLKQCEIKAYTKGAIVYEEGTMPNCAYIVKSGEFLKYVNTHENKLRRQFSGYNKVVEFQNLNYYIHPSIKYLHNQQLTRIATITKGSLVGEEDLINGTKHVYNIVCNSAQGEMIIIKKEAFEGTLLKSGNTLRNMHSVISARKEYQVEKETQGRAAINRFNITFHKQQSKSVDKTNNENPLPMHHTIKYLPVSLKASAISLKARKRSSIKYQNNTMYCKGFLKTSMLHELQKASFGKTFSKSNDMILFTARKSLSKLSFHI